MPKKGATGLWRPAGCIILGIWLYHNLSREVSWIGYLAAFLLILFLVFWGLALQKPLVRRRRLAGVVGLTALLTMAFWHAFEKNRPETLPVPTTVITHYKIRLVKAVALKPTSVSTVGELEAILANGKWKQAKGQIALFLPRSVASDSLQYGHRLLVKGTFAPPAEPANPFQFDYRRFLKLKHIQYQVYLPAGSWLVTGLEPPSAVVAASLLVRNKLEKAFQENIRQKRELTIAHALVLGVQHDLDASLRNAYAKTGTMHVLAVSGLHVGLLYGVLLLLLKSFRRGNKSRLVVSLVIIGVVWFYAFVTGMSASVLRSVCMFSLVEIGLLLRRKASVLNTLGVVAIALLLYEPNYLFDVGFQLSFLAVAGIVVLQPLIIGLWQPANKVIQFFWSLLAISLAAQLATFPVSLYYFHQFPVYFWLANLAAVPLASAALYGGVGFMLFFWIPGVNRALGYGLEKILWLLDEVLLGLESWPHAVLDGFVISPGQVLSLYLFIVAVLLFVLRKNLAWLGFAAVNLAFIAGVELAEARQQQKTQELVIHSVRRSSAWSIVQGRSAVLVADSTFFQNEGAFTYQVQPFWWTRGVRQESRFCLDFEKTGQKLHFPFYTFPNGNQLLVWKGKKILWMKTAVLIQSSNVPIDAVVLQKNVRIKAEELKGNFGWPFIIVDQTNSHAYAQRKALELRQAGFQVQVLGEDGAWFIRK